MDTIGDERKAIKWEPHQSAMTLDPLLHFAKEMKEKLCNKQAWLGEWDAIKANPPTEFKLSPIAEIPHKSKLYWSILDLSFQLRLQKGGYWAAVNKTIEKTAPAGAIDQIGLCLARIIHAFAEAEDDAKIFMAKWDIKDGFWQMDCAAGDEWNFFLCPSAMPRGTCTACDPNILANRMSRITTIFLYDNRNSLGHH
jgi:hypothetical protein